VVPGSAFGMDPADKYIRFSCATDMKDLELAMEVIEEAIEELIKR
jgi:aspartate/methionine/tyrosine aminotransferase